MRLVRVTFLGLVIALTAGASQPTLRGDPSKLASWTVELRAAQPEEAFSAVYKVGNEHLVFLGAKHSNAVDSRTFAIIEEAYEAFEIDTLIIEGFSASEGPNPQRVLDWVAAKKLVNGFQEGGEAVPAIRRALEEGAVIWGGEPDDKTIRDLGLAEGLTIEDLIGFYALRNIPQWIRERKVTGADDPRVEPLLEASLIYERERLGADDSVLAGYAAFIDWYLATNGKAFGSDFDPEETGPLADGRYGSNSIAAAISRARDSFLLKLVEEHLNQGETVLVVFGGSHLMLQRPALDDMLGEPCFVGDALVALEDC